jgi:TrmH family RNA methyltransferase
VRSPQGILAIARRPLWDWKNLFGRAPAPIVILDGIQDPGNVATIVRTAEAAGAAGIVTTPETASLFSPKALRGSAGSSLRLPILEHRDAEEIICALRVAGCGILAADAQNGPEGAVSYSHVDWTKPWAIVLGQEGSGLSAGWQAARRVFIPMKPVVESLNVAAAAAILLFEFHRQREQA